MTAKVDYKNMSDQELERLAPEDPEAAWELFLRLPCDEIDRQEIETPDPNADTQLMSHALLDD